MNRVTVSLNREYVESFKMDVLAAGACGSIFPLSIIKEKKFTKCIYNTEGYIKVSALANIPAKEILTIAEKVLNLVENCQNYLLFPEEYILSSETIYIRDDYKDIKITYIPIDKKERQRNVLSYFIRSLRNSTTENGRTYLETLANLLDCEELKTERIIGFIEKLKQEINICGIK